MAKRFHDEPPLVSCGGEIFHVDGLSNFQVIEEYWGRLSGCYLTLKEGKDVQSSLKRLYNEDKEILVCYLVQKAWADQCGPVSYSVWTRFSRSGHTMLSVGVARTHLSNRF